MTKSKEEGFIENEELDLLEVLNREELVILMAQICRHLLQKKNSHELTEKQEVDASNALN